MDQTELFHYGIKRRSGRYPWGSGDRPHQRLERHSKDNKRKPNIFTESPLNRVIRLYNEREAKLKEDKIRVKNLNKKMDKSLMAKGLEAIKNWIETDIAITKMAISGTYVVIGEDEHENMFNLLGGDYYERL